MHVAVGAVAAGFSVGTSDLTKAPTPSVLRLRIARNSTPPTPPKISAAGKNNNDRGANKARKKKNITGPDFFFGVRVDRAKSQARQAATVWWWKETKNMIIKNKDA
jgi:hypothetical protein